MLQQQPTASGQQLPDFLPGRLWIDAGDTRDYATLARFHYRSPRPATWCRTLVVRYAPPPTAGLAHRPVAIAVLSWPTRLNRHRSRVFDLARLPYGERIRFANLHLRTVSRVIVHPQFRGLGLAVVLVRRLIQECPTRYVEASAVMGHMHPMFECAGMIRAEGGIDEVGGDQVREPAYFWADRASRTMAAPGHPSVPQAAAAAADIAMPPETRRAARQ